VSRLSRAELLTAWGATVGFFTALGFVANLLQIIQVFRDRQFSVILITIGILACGLVVAIAWHYIRKKQKSAVIGIGYGSLKRSNLTALVVTCLVIATLSLAALGASAIYVTTGNYVGFLTSPPPSQPHPSAIPSLPTINPSTDSMFADNFDGTELNSAHWHAPPVPRLIHQSNGSLNFQVGDPPSTGDVYTELQPRLSGSPITKIDFTVSVPSYEKAGEGGVQLVLNANSPRPQRILFGPSPNGPQVYTLFCDRPLCRLGIYEDFIEGKYTGFGLGESVPVTVSHEAGMLRFSVRGVATAELPSPTDPITDFRFIISAGGNEIWNISVDNLIVH
jgi:hypothetical protein